MKEVVSFCKRVARAKVKASWLLNLIALTAVTQQVKSMEHKVGNKTASDVFADYGLRSLAQAACDGDEQAVRETVKRGTNPNGTGMSGITPLEWAVRCENVDGVKALLTAGADPNQAIPNEFTSVVYIAANRDDPGTLRALLDGGADANVYSLKSERTGISQALSHGMDTGDWRNWEVMLGKVDINRPYNKFGETIALRAANLNQFERVVQLLNRGYSYRLQELGRSAETAKNLMEPFATWRLRTMEMLQARGVVFPVGPTKVQRITEAELQLLPPNRR